LLSPSPFYFEELSLYLSHLAGHAWGVGTRGAGAKGPGARGAERLRWAARGAGSSSRGSMQFTFVLPSVAILEVVELQL